MWGRGDSGGGFSAVVGPLEIVLFGVGSGSLGPPPCMVSGPS